jgi:hypothetical protein
MLRHALVGFLARVTVAVVFAGALALLLALVRADGSFLESFEIACWLVGCLLLLLAAVGESPTMRGGSIDPLLAGFFPKGVTARMTEPYSGTRVSPAALFVLSALTLFGLAVALG